MPLKYEITPQLSSPRGTVQLLSQEKGIPWYAVLEGYGDRETDNRFPSEAEMFCNANLALAYGAKGIIYWTYNGGLIEPLGSDRYEFHPTERYYFVQKIFAMLDTIGPVLDDLVWIDSRATRALEENMTFPWEFSGSPETELVSVESYWRIYVGGEWLYFEDVPDARYLQIAIFADGAYDSWYVMFVNRRCIPGADARWITYTLRTTGGSLVYAVTHFLGDSTHMYWRDSWGMFTDSLALAPGHGELIHIQPALLVTDLTAMVNEGNIILNWSPPGRSGEITYEVFAASEADGDFQSIGTTTETTFSDTIGTASKRFYRVAVFEP